MSSFCRFTSTNVLAAMHKYYPKKQTVEVHCAKFEKSGVATSLLDMTARVTYEKNTTLFQDLVVILVLQIMLSSSSPSCLNAPVGA